MKLHQSPLPTHRLSWLAEGVASERNPELRMASLTSTSPRNLTLLCTEKWH